MASERSQGFDGRARKRVGTGGLSKGAVQPALIALGLVLVVVGAVALLVLGWRNVTADAAMVGSGVPAQEGMPHLPSRLWAIAAGLSMACGGAAIGIGQLRVEHSLRRGETREEEDETVRGEHGDSPTR